MRLALALLGLLGANAFAAPPTVKMISPLMGQVISKPMTFEASCKDDLGVSGVQFKVDGVQLGLIEKVAPYQQPFDPGKYKTGAHSVLAFCTDTGNNVVKSVAISFSIPAPVPSPSPSPSPSKSLVPAPVPSASPSPSPSGVPVDTGSLGYPTLPSSTDTRTIYVSDTGSDLNDGKTAAAPVKTVQKALTLTRAGFPDHILFRRGGVWSGFFPVPNGRSSTEPFVIGAYGDLSLERPKFLISGAGTLYGKFCGVNKWMESLHFYSFKRDPKAASFDKAANKEDNGFRCAGGTVQNLSFVDNKFEYLRQPLDFDGVYQHTVGIPVYKNFTFIRNCVMGAWASGAGVRDRMAEGIYISNAANVKLVENIFYQNGWNPNVVDSKRSYLNHSIYLKEVSGLEVRGNITALSAGLAFKFDSLKSMAGVAIDNNFAIGASNGIWVGSNDGVAKSYTNLIYSNNVHTNIGAIAQTDSGALLEQGLGPSFNYVNGLSGVNNLCFRKNFSQMSSKCVNLGNGTTGSVSGTVSWNWSTSEGSPAVIDSTRTLGTFYGKATEQAGIDYFYSQIILQRKGRWLNQFTAQTVNDYFRAGYKLK